jgi:hypothetical protein
VSALNHQQKVAAGAALICAGSYVLWQTYDATGRRRPFWVKLLPGA